MGQEERVDVPVVARMCLGASQGPSVFDSPVLSRGFLQQWRLAYCCNLHTALVSGPGQLCSPSFFFFLLMGKGEGVRNRALI